MRSITIAVLLGACLCAAPAAAQDIKREDVTFAAGKSSAAVKGTIKGDQTIDYVLRAKAGQTMVVKLTASNRFAYFNVNAPGDDTSMFVGSSSGDRFEGKLPADGDTPSAST